MKIDGNDKKIFDLVKQELDREEHSLILIASVEDGEIDGHVCRRT